MTPSGTARTPVAASTQERETSFWAADIVLLVVIVSVVAAAYAFDRWSPRDLASWAASGVEVLLVVVPAAVWLIVFYRRDRVEPEPKHLVGAALVLSGLLAFGLGQPLIRAMDPHAWSTGSTLAALAASVLVIASVQEYVKYLAMRFAVVPTGEMDQRVDGIIYGTAAGLGYAVVLNLMMVREAGGADLGPIALTAAVVALAHAGFGGLLGYFLALDLLEDRPWWWLPAGFLAAVAANGTFFFFRTALTDALAAPGADPTLVRWVGLVLAVVVAAGISLTLAAMMHRAERRPTPQEAGG